jgi:acetyl-CoA C-acetyltransferase
MRPDLVFLDVSVSPSFSFTTPAKKPRTECGCAKAGLSLADIDLFEINEAFALVAENTSATLSSIATRSTSMAEQSRSVIPSVPQTRSSSARSLTSLSGTISSEGWVIMCAAGGMAPAIIIERI